MPSVATNIAPISSEISTPQIESEDQLNMSPVQNRDGSAIKVDRLDS